MVNTDVENNIIRDYNYQVGRYDLQELKKMGNFLGDNKEIIKRKKILYKSIRLYAEAKSLKELCKLNMRFFSGKIYCPTHMAPFHDPLYPKGTWDEIVDVDNINITDQLIDINKLGIYTINSQNGLKEIYEEGVGYNSRMFVTGLTTEKIAKKLYNYFSDEEETIVIIQNYSIIKKIIEIGLYEIPNVSIATNYTYNLISKKKINIRNLLPLTYDMIGDGVYTFNKILEKDSKEYSIISVVDLKYNRNTLFGKIINGLRSK